VSSVIDSLANFLNEIRDKFDNYKTIVTEKLPDSDNEDLH